MSGRTWCFDCHKETSWPPPPDWKRIRGVERCPRCAAFDATRTPEQIRSLVTPPYEERRLREKMFARDGGDPQ